MSRIRGFLWSVTCLAGAIGFAPLDEGRAFADEAPPTVSIGHHPLVKRGEGGRKAAMAGSSGFWMGTLAIGVALAVFGGVSLVAKKLRPGKDSGALRVIGRTSLSPRHSVCLLKVGERVLIVGTGTSGPPALLGELFDEEIPPASAQKPAIPPTRSIGGGS